MRRRQPAALVCIAGFAASAALYGCYSLASMPLEQATAVLHLTSRTGAVVSGSTAIVEISVIPEAPASLTLPEDTKVSITEATGSSGESVTVLRTLGGFRTETPLVIEEYGRAKASLTLGSSGSTTRQTSGSGGEAVLDDGFGHKLRLRSLSIAFDHTARGTTNLPRYARIVTPLAGGPLSLAQARIEGLAPETPVEYTVSLSDGGKVTDTGTADDTGAVSFTRFPSTLMDDVTSATLTFGATSTGS